MTRAFISVPVPELIRTNLLELERTERGISWSSSEQWHITIQFFEKSNIEKLERLFLQIEASKAVGTLGPRVTRLDHRILMVPVGGLSGVADQVRTTMAPQSSGDHLPFVGHITLGRMKATENAQLEGAWVEGVFQVDRLLLIESRIGPKGHTHTVVATQPLL